MVNNSTPTPSVHSQTDQKKLPIRVVCATKCSASDFFTSTLTGKSLHALSNDDPIDIIQIEIADNNSRGLSSVYNQAIEAAKSDPAILVFIHDDIMITDFFWTERVRSGLEDFDVVGLAGCQDRKPYQPSWCFSEYIPPARFIFGDLLRSGAVAHGEKPFAPISNFGPTLVECKLIDGLFLAANSETLVGANVQFDDNFKFHFYDMDFCRSVEKANLKMGTIPLSVVHKSSGNFATIHWRAAYQKYIEKWND
ncbi:glycosyltransferase family protein [Planktomarina temperata]|nr:glycosyltransferase family protein [Planktomarina temperata]